MNKSQLQDDVIVLGRELSEANARVSDLRDLLAASELRAGKLREALRKIEGRPKIWKDKGHVCDSKLDLEAIASIARAALAQDPGPSLLEALDALVDAAEQVAHGFDESCGKYPQLEAALEAVRKVRST